MFDPISARFASSFSRNGISDAATETSWFGDTSIMSTSLARDHLELALLPGGDALVDETTVLVEHGVRLGDGHALLVEGRHELHFLRHVDRRAPGDRASR